MQIPC